MRQKPRLKQVFPAEAQGMWGPIGMEDWLLPGKEKQLFCKFRLDETQITALFINGFWCIYDAIY